VTTLACDTGNDDAAGDEIYAWGFIAFAASKIITNKAVANRPSVCLLEAWQQDTKNVTRVKSSEAIFCNCRSYFLALMDFSPVMHTRMHSLSLFLSLSHTLTLSLSLSLSLSHTHTHLLLYFQISKAVSSFVRFSSDLSFLPPSFSHPLPPLKYSQ